LAAKPLIGNELPGQHRKLRRSGGVGVGGPGNPARRAGADRRRQAAPFKKWAFFATFRTQFLPLDQLFRFVFAGFREK